MMNNNKKYRSRAVQIREFDRTKTNANSVSQKILEYLQKLETYRIEIKDLISLNCHEVNLKVFITPSGVEMEWEYDIINWFKIDFEHGLVVMGADSASMEIAELIDSFCDLLKTKRFFYIKESHVRY